ncbi:MAG: GNAT family N-acetyltransferase [Dehalococcoidia bacterium]|nr:GNAT family N-acetyltransferase [Dehalococcoidia bacterium]MDP7200749.1 GNAT family N-acetyltransferase [Dehalococcoidia bacterium]MDP7510318.1 GNAT family N-acetyltransferase [Dehalococcoidia bacterium]
MEIIRPINTERLMVRCFEDTDWPGFLKFMTDPAATRHLLFSDDMKSEDGARALFESTIESYSTDDPIHAYAVALKNNRFIGSCGFSPIDEVAGLYECFYTLLPEFWNNGYATEATKALIDYCFEVYRISEMRAYVSAENPASSKVAERAGMKYHGIQKHPLTGTQGMAYAIEASDGGHEGT